MEDKQNSGQNYRDELETYIFKSKNIEKYFFLILYLEI